MPTTVTQRTTAPAQSGARQDLARVGWLHPEEMEFSEWVAAGRRLGEIGRGSQWWIGDWLLYGTAQFGERYVEASRITGYDPKSLRNMRYVASQFDLSLRRDNLNWSHHALLAGLDPEERSQWLDRAVADRMSVDDLRCELRAAGRGNYANLEAESASTRPEVEGAVICPNCGTEVPLDGAVRKALEPGDA
jgi:hypothetical protein